MSQYNDAEFATNGGQAFPCDHRPNWMHPGMTLRDYFAAKAMQGLIEKFSFPSDLARNAYEIADAMLKARG